MRGETIVTGDRRDRRSKIERKDKTGTEKEKTAGIEERGEAREKQETEEIVEIRRT